MSSSLREVTLSHHFALMRFPPWILRPALGTPAQEGHGSVWAKPEESHKSSQRAGQPHLWRQAKTVGGVQPGEEKGLGI